MEIIFVIAAICVICSTLLFLFPKYFLAKLSYKDVTYPDDYENGDIRFMKLMFTLFMILSYTLLFLSMEIVDYVII